MIGKKTTFGRRSVFVKALGLASDFLSKNPLENKHIVLITDGTDSIAGHGRKRGGHAEDPGHRYQRPRDQLHADGDRRHLAARQRHHENAAAQRPCRTRWRHPARSRSATRQMRRSRIGINTDRAFIKKDEIAQSGPGRERKAARAAFPRIPTASLSCRKRPDEMVQKSALVAQMIDSGYVVTYIPKRPLSEVRGTQERTIDVTSKRPGLMVQAKRS